MKKQIISAVLGLSVAASALTGLSLPAYAAAKSPQYQENARVMEDLNRGLIAVKTTADTRGQTVNGVYLSWRLLGTESLENQAFDIYRDGKKFILQEFMTLPVMWILPERKAVNTRL